MSESDPISPRSGWLSLWVALWFRRSDGAGGLYSTLAHSPGKCVAQVVPWGLASILISPNLTYTYHWATPSSLWPQAQQAQAPFCTSRKSYCGWWERQARQPFVPVKPARGDLSSAQPETAWHCPARHCLPLPVRVPVPAPAPAVPIRLTPPLRPPFAPSPAGCSCVRGRAPSSMLRRHWVALR